MSDNLPDAEGDVPAPAAKKTKFFARRSKSAGSPGFVGSSPSSLASLAKGKKYFIDPYTPFTPRPLVTKGFPAKPLTRASNEDGLPAYLVDQHGHLMPRFKKAGRAAFPEVPEVGPASWAFKRMGYV